MKRNPTLPFALVAITAILPTITLADGTESKRLNDTSTLYTLSNDATTNAVHVYRTADGTIKPIGNYPTGGKGTGKGLGNQGALAISANERYLFAINAGSNEVSVFEIQKNGLKLLDHASETGKTPVSITVHGNLVYVVNAGDDSVFGYNFDPAQGKLLPLTASYSPLSGKGTGAAQISFNNDGNVLVVSEKATNKLSSFYLNEQGIPENSHVTNSAGATPFGFAFGKRDQVFVSEAQGGGTNPGGSTVSSYTVDSEGNLTLIDGEVKNFQTAACWVATTPNGRTAFTTDTGSNAISSYRIDFGGHLKLAQSKAADVNKPIDLAISSNGETLFSLNSGDHTLSAFRVNNYGQLRKLQQVSSVPAFATGLIVR